MIVHSNFKAMEINMIQKLRQIIEILFKFWAVWISLKSL